MGKRGPKAKTIIDQKWNSKLAYAVGLISSDGCLSKDKRHISFTSKDIEQINNFKKCLNLQNIKTGNNYSGAGNLSHKVQFGSVLFYDFLTDIGLMPNKSKIIDELKIPEKYFFDFLRGTFDGDGSTYSYWDKRWRSSFMFYLTFVSASERHIRWIRTTLLERLNVKGHVSGYGRKATFQLKYAKKEAMEIISKMYYNPRVICLKRKRDKIFKSIKVNKLQQEMYS